jgi:hypothetical protein
MPGTLFKHEIPVEIDGQRVAPIEIISGCIVIPLGANGTRSPALYDATRKSQFVFVEVWNITIFWRQEALFNGTPMEAIRSEISEVCKLSSPVQTVWYLSPGSRGQHQLLCALSTAESLSYYIQKVQGR